VAQYFKRNKPKSKIIMLDGHFDVVSKGPMFKAAWKKFYPGIIEHRPYNLVTKVDHKSMVVTSEFEDVKADVINIVPKQRANAICAQAGVRADTAGVWCPVDGVTYESPKVPFVHVLGDSVASNMPKSAHVSNNQAKICAAALVELFNDREPNPYPVYQLFRHVGRNLRSDCRGDALRPRQGSLYPATGWRRGGTQR